MRSEGGGRSYSNRLLDAIKQEANGNLTPAMLQALKNDIEQDERRRIKQRAEDRLAFDLDEGSTAGQFAEGARHLPPPLWGTQDGAGFNLWPRGEFTILAGGDGTGKTTTAQGLLMGLAGVKGWGTWFEQAVQPLQPGQWVAYLALDRPQQAMRAWLRIYDQATPEEQEHLDQRVRFIQNTPTLTTFEDLADYLHTLPDGLAVVIIDNVVDAFGDLADTERATLAGRSCNHAVKTLGVDLLVLAHPNKDAEKHAKLGNLKLHHIYGGRNFYGKSGSALGLQVSAGGVVYLNHLKPPNEFEASGRYTLTPQGTWASGELQALKEAEVRSAGPYSQGSVTAAIVDYEQPPTVREIVARISPELTEASASGPDYRKAKAAVERTLNKLETAGTVKRGPVRGRSATWEVQQP